jgi:hypothetical protein
MSREHLEGGIANPIMSPWLSSSLAAIVNDNAHLVIERIERAFAGVGLGCGVSLREADVIDDYGTDTERKQARAQDEQDDWRRIPEDLIARYHWCLPFLDAEGMRFHLPAYMRFALRRYRDSTSMSIDFTIYALDREDDRLRGLTTPQRAAVRQFLKFMAFNGGRHVDSGAAKHALEVVWRVKTDSQQDGPANGSQPSRSENNPMSSAAGSRR